MLKHPRTYPLSPHPSRDPNTACAPRTTLPSRRPDPRPRGHPGGATARCDSHTDCRPRRHPGLRLSSAGLSPPGDSLRLLPATDHSVAPRAPPSHSHQSHSGEECEEELLTKNTGPAAPVHHPICRRNPVEQARPHTQNPGQRDSPLQAAPRPRRQREVCEGVVDCDPQRPLHESLLVRSAQHL